MGSPRHAPATATLADLLADPPPVIPGAGREVLEQARARLEAAAGAAARTAGWTVLDPLRLAKRPVTWLVRCPRRAVSDDGPGNQDDLALGLVADAAAKLAMLSPRRPVTVERALAYLAALGETSAADHLAAPGAATAGLRDEAARRVARLTAALPAAVEPGWWPRVEEPVRATLAGGAVTLTGRLDVLLGGPPSGRPAIVVEVKGGRWYDGMRADAHLYALLVGLRDGVAPAAVVTVVADGTTQVEPVRPAVIEHAARVVEMAVGVAARLAGGGDAEARPGSHCHHCPARADCSSGRQWLAANAAVEPQVRGVTGAEPPGPGTAVTETPATDTSATEIPATGTSTTPTTETAATGTPAIAEPAPAGRRRW